MVSPTRILASAASAASLAIALLAAAIAATPARAQHCPAPTGLTATNGTNCDGITVSWGGTLSGTGYRIARATNSQGTGALTLGPITQNFLEDSSALPGVRYYYWVQQYGGVCGTTSPAAGPVSGIIGRPGVPTNVNASNDVWCERVHVTWSSVAGASSYEVEGSTYFGDVVTLATTTQTFYDDETTDPEHGYYYRVRARSATGCVSDWSGGEAFGSAASRPLPDLTINPNTAYQAVLSPSGRMELKYAVAVANIGTAPFHVFPHGAYPDGSRNFFQRTIDCDGRTDDAYVGRYNEPTAHNYTTIPNFVRVFLREPGPNENLPAAALAIDDAPMTNIKDDLAYNLGLPGAPAAPQYTTLINGSLFGISVGWQSHKQIDSEGQRIPLECVTDGGYWLEYRVDPDNLIDELDESNNVAYQWITLTGIPQVTTTPPCFHPATVARLRGPAELIVAAGAPTDSLVASVWSADFSPSPFDAKVGYRLVEPFDFGIPGDDDSLWTWTAVPFLRSDGFEYVFGGALVISQPGEYYYAFRFDDSDGHHVRADLDGSLNGFQYARAGRITVNATTAVGNPPAHGPLAFGVLSNPARRTTRFTLGLPEATTARIAIHDARGRRVREIDAGALDAGPQVVEWDGRGDDGVTAPSGIYFARLETARGEQVAAKWVLVP